MTGSRGFVVSAVFAVAITLLQAAPVFAGSTAQDTWGALPKKIAIQAGTSVSVWSNADRAQITGGAVSMTPVGDGTYEYIVGLTAGQSYNYIFYANPGATAVGGTQAWNDYYDIVPTSGTIRASRNGFTYNDTTSTYYATVNYDARRVLTVPSTMNAGETLWVFNNWGETPTTLANLAGSGYGNTAIMLTWTGPYGFWGTGGEAFKAADVLAGGWYQIYRSSTPVGGYALIDTIDGGRTSYIDTGLTPGSYYYFLRPMDAYRGVTTTDTFQRLYMSDSLASGYRQCTTAFPIRSFFIVRDANWEDIERSGRVAWVSNESDPLWGPKFPVHLVRVDLGGDRMPAPEQSPAPNGPVIHEREAATFGAPPASASVPSPGADPPPPGT